MATYYEVIELSNGEIALQKEGDTRSKPLVTMRFSSELIQFLQDAKIDIAKIMIQAGLEHVADLVDEFGNAEALPVDADSDSSTSLQEEDERMNVVVSHLLH